MNEALNSKHIAIYIIIFCISFLAYTKKAYGLSVQVTATVAGCGDTIISNGEQCEGVNLGGSSCSALGFGGGTLSCTSACTFNTSACTASPISGGGIFGGGGGTSPLFIPVPETNVVFSGKATKGARVTILKDGQIAVTSITNSEDNFTTTISGLSTGNYIFSVYSENENNQHSLPFTFPMYIQRGVTTKISDIILEKENIVSVEKRLSLTRGEIDINKDGRLNFLDFSEMLFWYKKDTPSKEIDFNGDNKITLVDFSILAFYWTG